MVIAMSLISENIFPSEQLKETSLCISIDCPMSDNFHCIYIINEYYHSLGYLSILTKSHSVNLAEVFIR